MDEVDTFQIGTAFFQATKAVFENNGELLKSDANVIAGFLGEVLASAGAITDLQRQILQEWLRSRHSVIVDTIQRESVECMSAALLLDASSFAKFFVSESMGLSGGGGANDAELQSLRAEVTELRQSSADILNLYDEAQKMIAELQGAVSAGDGQKDAEIERLRSENQTLFAVAEADSAKLHGEISELQKKLAHAESSAVTENTSAQQKLQESLEKASNLQTQLSKVETQLHGLQNEVEAAKNEKLSLLKENRDLSERLAAAEKQAAPASQTVTHAEQAPAVKISHGLKASQNVPHIPKIGGASARPGGRVISPRSDGSGSDQEKNVPTKMTSPRVAKVEPQPQPNVPSKPASVPAAHPVAKPAAESKPAVASTGAVSNDLAAKLRARLNAGDAGAGAKSDAGPGKPASSMAAPSSGGASDELAAKLRARLQSNAAPPATAGVPTSTGTSASASRGTAGTAPSHTAGKDDASSGRGSTHESSPAAPTTDVVEKPTNAGAASAAASESGANLESAPKPKVPIGRPVLMKPAAPSGGQEDELAAKLRRRLERI